MSGSLFSPSSASLTVAGSNQAVSQLTTGTYPNEGSRGISVQYNWLSNAVYSEDLGALLARGVESTPQAVFFDNSQCASYVTLYIPGVSQSLVFPPFSQGLLPVFFGTAMNYQITVQAAGAPTAFVAPAQVTKLVFLNVPVSPSVWSTSLPEDGGRLTQGINATTTLKVGPGRLATVTLQTATTVAAITIEDFVTGDTETLANALLVIPSGAAAGTVYTLNIPFSHGLKVNYGTGVGTMTLAYT